MLPTKFHEPICLRNAIVCDPPFLPFYRQELPLFCKRATGPERVMEQPSEHEQLELFRFDVDYSDDKNIISIKLEKINKIVSEIANRKISVVNLDGPINFSDFLPRRKLGILRYHFGSIVAKVPELDGMTTKLYDAGKFMVGDVVEMTPSQIEEITGATPEEMDSLVKTLAKFDLELGKRIANWSSERWKSEDRGR